MSKPSSLIHVATCRSPPSTKACSFSSVARWRLPAVTDEPHLAWDRLCPPFQPLATGPALAMPGTASAQHLRSTIAAPGAGQLGTGEPRDWLPGCGPHRYSDLVVSWRTNAFDGSKVACVLLAAARGPWGGRDA